MRAKKQSYVISYNGQVFPSFAVFGNSVNIKGGTLMQATHRQHTELRSGQTVEVESMGIKFKVTVY